MVRETHSKRFCYALFLDRGHTTVWFRDWTDRVAGDSEMAQKSRKHPAFQGIAAMFK
ncbi:MULTISPECIES: hypothetical protein [unclassified Ensifer]|jgi:hypothetical protein|uniref:hypothetical protein n=1 Tax=unclassified Ensifer TaxID=2633371 RepID=UPI000AF9B2E1|nr:MULTISPECIES: hypothetical protein [unclassified Ensifer]